MKIIKNILLIALVLFLANSYKSEIGNSVRIIKNEYFPCETSVAYSIGTYDERFGLPKEEFLKYLKNAEKKWEDAVGGKNLFEYKEEGGMPVNLVYDTRQEATVKLKDMNLDLDNGKASYDAMKAKYDELYASYRADKNAFNARANIFEARNSEYNKSVKFWNSKGGASGEDYAKLESERTWLNNEANMLNSLQNSLNSKVDEVNALSRALNEFGNSLNLGVAKFNEISAEALGEFEEGVYHTGPDGTWIDIYQYENKTKLERVVVHEFGHALGLEHVEDRDAIMNVLNNSSNKELTNADIVELNRACNASIKSKAENFINKVI